MSVEFVFDSEGKCPLCRRKGVYEDGLCIFHTLVGKKKVEVVREDPKKLFSRVVEVKVSGEQDEQQTTRFVEAFTRYLEEVKAQPEPKEGEYRKLDCSGFIFPDLNEPEWFKMWNQVVDDSEKTLFQLLFFDTHGIEASFADAVFTGAPVFSGATFSGRAEFSRAIFCGEAEFLGATFNGLARFSGITFSGLADFSKATFSEKADFSGATFSGGIDFSRAIFIGYVGFSGAKFGRDALFSGATFSGQAAFSGATFSEKATFSGATFSRRAEFLVATFCGKVDFSQATFSEKAWFSLATFSGEAAFSLATFSGEAMFVLSTFSGEAVFSEAIVADKAEMVFEWLNGNGEIGFHQLKNHGLIRIRQGGKQVFTWRFTDLRFHGEGHLIIEDTDLSKASFYLTNFVYVRPRVDLIRITWGEKGGNKVLADDFMELGDKSLFPFLKGQHPTPDHYAELERLYRQTRLSYESRGDIVEAGDFFMGEMRARGRRYPWYTPVGLFHHGYGWLARWGESPGRVVRRSLAALFIIATALLFSGFYFGKEYMSWDWACAMPPVCRFLHNAGHALLYALQAGTLFRSAPYVPAGGGSVGLITLAHLLGPLMITLLGISLRRRFRRISGE